LAKAGCLSIVITTATSGWPFPCGASGI